MELELTKPQTKFIQSQSKYRLFCAGYGSGKSECMAVAATLDAMEGADAVIGLYAPTYTDLTQITMPRVSQKLDQFGIRYRLNKNDKMIYTSSSGVGDFLMRSMDNPENIVGYEQYAGHIDEIDTMKQEKAAEAWKKILGRNRQKLSNGKENNRLSAYTTPEGFRFCYNRWVVQKAPGYEIIQASSFSNRFLPREYIRNLKETYSAEVYKAYVMGEFTNLTSGTVYDSYDRDLHRSNETIKDKETLYIGQDFNVNNMASSIAVKRGSKFHVVRELTGILDTPTLVQMIKDQFPGHRIIMFPDASGKSRKSNDASSSDISLLKSAGFEVRAKLKNPPVRNRILSLNLAFAHGNLYINDYACPVISRSLEQQVYDKNGEPDKDGITDHTNDALGYHVYYEMPVHRPSMNTDMVKFG